MVNVKVVVVGGRMVVVVVTSNDDKGRRRGHGSGETGMTGVISVMVNVSGGTGCNR